MKMRRGFSALVAIFMIAVSFIAAPVAAQILEEPETCIDFLDPYGYQVFFAPLSCLHDVLPEDAPEAGNGDILYQYGEFMAPREGDPFIVAHLFILRRTPAMFGEAQMVMRANLSHFGPFSGPAHCFCKADVLDLESGGEFVRLLELPSGADEVVDTRFDFSLFEVVEVGELFTVSILIYDKDMSDNIECVVDTFLDGLLGAVGIVTIVVADEQGPTTDLPTEFTLGSAYPNPFNPSTIIPFELAEASEVSLTVYDGLGRYVATLADGYMSTGQHEVVFEAQGLPSGVYFYQLRAESRVRHGRVSLVK